MATIPSPTDPMAAVMARIEASARATAFRTRKWIARDFRADPRRLDKLRPGLSHKTPHDMISDIREIASDALLARAPAHVRETAEALVKTLLKSTK